MSKELMDDSELLPPFLIESWAGFLTLASAAILHFDPETAFPKSLVSLLATGHKFWRKSAPVPIKIDPSVALLDEFSAEHLTDRFLSAGRDCLGTWK